MRAKKVKESLMSIQTNKTLSYDDHEQDELVVKNTDSKDDLINIVKSSYHMLKRNIEPFLHSKEEYKNAKDKALYYLEKKYNIKEEDIDLNESLNEAFDVLTWSKKHLPKMIAIDIEEAHEGGFGEKLQTSLLKIANSEELLNWYNKNFEVGMIKK